MVNFYEHGAVDMIKSLQLTVLFTSYELGATIGGLLLATPVTLTLLCDAGMELCVAFVIPFHITIY